MIGYFVVLLHLLLLSVDVAVLAKRRFSQTAAFANFCAILVLYIGGLFLQMRIAGYVLLAAIDVLTVIVIATHRNKDEWLGIIKEPAVLLYGVIGIALPLIFLFMVSTHNDEYTHWALIVKNMLAYDNFGNVGNTTTMFNQYEPATGLFAYAFLFIQGKFVNGILYCAMSLMVTSVMLPFAALFADGKSWTGALGCAAALTLPMLFKPTVYSNLLVDALLGLEMAYVYVAYRQDKGRTDVFSWLNIGLACAVLCLTKSSGIALAVFALLLTAGEAFCEGRDSLKRFFGKKYTVAWLLIPVICLVLAKLSWSWFVGYYDVRPGWDTGRLTLQNVGEWLRAPTEFQQAVTAKFFKHFFVSNFAYDAYTLWQPQLFVLLLIAAASVAIGLKTKRIAQPLTQGLLMWVLVIGYGVAMLLMYLFSFSEAEGMALASLSRYNGTVTIGVMFILLYQLLQIFVVPLHRKELEYVHANPRAKWRAGYLRQAIVMAALAVIFVGVGMGVNKPKYDAYQRQNAAWIQTVEQLSAADSVYIVVKDDEAWPQAVTYLRLRFLATPVQTSGYTEGGSFDNGDNPVCYAGNPFSSKMSVQELSQEMAAYTRVYLQDVWDDFAQKYAALFADEILPDRLYDVHVADGQVQLTLVEQA